MGEEEPKKIFFLVVGMVTSPNFQKCKYYVEKLHSKYPNLYSPPHIRPMLNVDWIEYLTKVRRRLGGKLWELSKPVAVFLDEMFIGDDKSLEQYVLEMYKFSVIKNFEALGIENCVKMIQSNLDRGRKFVYFTIAIDRRVIGALLFVLYADLVPITCENFLKRCNNKKHGYLGTHIHRIAKPSWIQAGDYFLRQKKMPCENYIIPHDRRGVLSMTNAGRHKQNSTQFHVALNPTPWMDYRYVAFGQLLQGEDVLQVIEKQPTYYESPRTKIQIVKCGEFSLDSEVVLDEKELKYVDDYIGPPDIEKLQCLDVVDPRDVDSVLHEDRYKKGLYAFEKDLRSYFPFLHLPDYLLWTMIDQQPCGEEEGYDQYYYAKDLLQNHLQAVEKEEPNPLGANKKKICDRRQVIVEDSYDTHQTSTEKLVATVLKKDLDVAACNKTIALVPKCKTSKPRVKLEKDIDEKMKEEVVEVHNF